MLMDDKEEEVREAVVRSLGLLFGFINDADKYSQVQSGLYWLINGADEYSHVQIFLMSDWVTIGQFICVTKWVLYPHNMTSSACK